MRQGIAIAGAALTVLAASIASWHYSPALADGAGHGFGKKPPFVVDADWPKSLPNNWIVGQVAGIAVDRHDRIWIVQRPRSLTADERGSDPVPPDPRRSDCCDAAPSVMVFDRQGHLIRRWGGPADPGFLTARCTPAMGCEWPTNEHGIFVDHNDYVYIAGNGGGDHQVLKFTTDGTFIMQIGKAGLTRRQQRHQRRAERNAAARPAGRHRSRSTDQRVVHRRRLREQARAGRRCGHGALQAALGRLRHDAKRRRPGRLRAGRAGGTAVPQPGALRAHRQRRPGLRLRPREQPLSGVPARTASS